jgi:hypothetical protein
LFPFGALLREKKNHTNLGLLHKKRYGYASIYVPKFDGGDLEMKYEESLVFSIFQEKHGGVLLRQ